MVQRGELNSKVIWQRDNVVGVAFAPAPDDTASDLDARLRESEKKKRELQMQIQRLLGR